MTVAFDTLAFSKTLEDAGFNRKQSEALAKAVQEVAMTNVATREDVANAVHTLTMRGFSALFVGLGLVTAILGTLIAAF